MADGAVGRIGAPAAPRVVSASEDGTGVVTTPRRPMMAFTATATTTIMKYALAPIVTVSITVIHSVLCMHVYICTSLTTWYNVYKRLIEIMFIHLETKIQG